MIAIKEAKDLTKIGPGKLLGSLMTHEIISKSNQESEKSDESKKKKKIPFKTSSSQRNEEIKDDRDNDEKMTLFTRRFNKMLKNGQFSRRQ